MKPISDFYCKPANEEEAREIVERAVAHGAGLHESVGQGQDKYTWDEYVYWGVFDGKTRTCQLTFERSETELLTLDELRERAPLVSEMPEYERVLLHKGHYIHSNIDAACWKACRRALYFAGLIRVTATEEDLKQAAESLDQDTKNQIDAGTAALFANLTSPESAKAADKMFEAGEEEFAAAFVKGGEHDGIRMAEKDGPETAISGNERIWKSSGFDEALKGITDGVNEALRKIGGKALDDINKKLPVGLTGYAIGQESKQEDEVNNPSHYASGDIECIDAIQASMSLEEFQGYCKGNVQKYMWRWRDKGGRQSLEKAQWYLNKILEVTK